MEFHKIYPLFKEKLKAEKEDRVFRVILSFKNVEDKIKFKSSYQKDCLLEFEALPLLNLELSLNEIKKLNKNNSILSIEEDQELFLSTKSISEFIDLDTYRESQIVYTGKNVSVGLIDTGVYQNIKGLSNINIKKFLISDENIIISDKLAKQSTAHGSLMAGILVNKHENNKNKFLGISPDIKILDFDISNERSKFYFSSILKVLDYVKKKKLEFDILLIPFSTQKASDGKDILSQVLNDLVDGGNIIVCPSGNFGPNAYSIGSPGAAERVITVGSLNKLGGISRFSGRGPTLDERNKPDFCFPGENVIVDLSEKIKVKITGTSASAAVCVGIVSLLKEYNPQLTPDEIVDILKKSSEDLNYNPNDQGYGTISISKLFKDLGLFHEKLVPYTYLLKKSLIYTVECLAVLLILTIILLNYRTFIF
jgi:serine protease AprX